MATFLLTCAAWLPAGEAQTPPVDGAAQADEAESAPDPSTGLILWLFPPSGAGTEVVEEFRAHLREALAGEHDRHLLTEQAFRRHVARHSAPLPTCTMGLEPCVSPHTLAFDALRFAAVVRLRLQTAGSSYEVSYEILDRRGQASRTGAVEAGAVRTLAFDTVREIFDATGTVAFDSNPRGAIVEIGGEVIGTTPMSERLPVGRHRFRLTLGNHRPFEGQVEVTSAGSFLVQHDLGLLPGTLLIEEAPPGARLFINGVEQGPADEPLDLEPGHYTVEVRADGFESYQDTVRVVPGGEIRRVATLAPRSALLNDVPPETIALQRYGARLAFEQSFQLTTFRNARAELGDRDFEFRGFTRDGALPDETLRRFIAPNGLRLDLFYTGKNFGMTLLSLSYLSSTPNLPARLEVRPSRDEFDVTVEAVRRLQVRPFQVSYRLFKDNLVPYFEGGTGISFQWIDVGGELLDETVTMGQTEAFWSLGAGLQYFFTPQLSAHLRYGVQGYFNAGLGAEHFLTLGVGGALQNLFGFEPEPPGKL